MLIPARTPFYLTNASDTTKDLTVKLKIYPVGDATPSDFQYVIQKKKYSAAAELLSVNISKFIRDYFDHTPPASLPINYTSYTYGQILTVDAYVQGVLESHSAWDGLEAFDVSTAASIQTARPIYEGSPAFFMAEHTNMVEVKWSSDSDSHTFVVPTGHKIIPVLNDNVDYTNSRYARVQGYNTGGSSPSYDRIYYFDCPPEEGVTIAYINRWGAWETFDAIGRLKANYLGTSKEYVSSLGYERQINSQATKSLMLNVGFVGYEFTDVMVDLLLSESIWLYKEGAAERLVRSSKTVQQLSSAYDGVTVPNIEFKVATPLIPLV